MNLLGKLTCFIFRKHKRGKRITKMVRDDVGNTRSLSNTEQFQCPRCLATWTRPIRSPKPAPAIPASIRKVGP